MTSSVRSSIGRLTREAGAPPPQVYPKITKLSAVSGSVAGGQLLTVSGAGFSLDTTENTVEVRPPAGQN